MQQVGAIPLSRRKAVEVGLACCKGAKPDALNQDNMFALSWNTDQEFLLGVFDGHGPQGEVFSNL